MTDEEIFGPSSLVAILKKLLKLLITRLLSKFFNIYLAYIVERAQHFVNTVTLTKAYLFIKNNLLMS
jgi:hypothetical protein